MNRKWMSNLVLAVLTASAAARAGTPLENALASIPSDAVAFVSVPSLAQLDANIQRAVRELELAPFMPPPMNSPVELLKQYLQMTTGLDESGAATLVLLPASSPEELEHKHAIIVAASDPKALLEAMGGQAGEGGTWSLNLFGHPVAAATASNRVVVAPSGDTARAVADAKGGIADKLSANDRAALENLDVVLWADAERLFKLFKPNLDEFLAMVAAEDDTESKAAAKQLERFFTESKSLMAGLSAGPAGVGVRFGFAARPDTDLAKSLRMKVTSDSLLAGLPDEKFVLVYGTALDPEHSKEAMKSLDPYFESAAHSETVNKEQLTGLKDLASESFSLLTGLRAGLSAVPPGPGGLIHATLILETSDSAKALKVLEKLIPALTKLFSDEAIQKAMSGLTYKPDAEELSGAKVHHLAFDPGTLPDVDEEQLESLPAILGKDGLMIRVSAVDDKTVVLLLGGGSEGMTRLIEQARRKTAPLAETAGIKRLAKHLPEKRGAVLYVAVDQILALINHAAEALDEEQLPVQMPEMDAPLAMAVSGQENTVQIDLFVPTELIVASKNAILGMIFGQMGALE